MYRSVANSGEMWHHHRMWVWASWRNVSGMWWFVIGKVVPYILKLLLQNDLPNNAVSFPRRPTPLWESQPSQVMQCFQCHKIMEFVHTT